MFIKCHGLVTCLRWRCWRASTGCWDFLCFPCLMTGGAEPPNMKQPWIRIRNTCPQSWINHDKSQWAAYHNIDLNHWQSWFGDSFRSKLTATTTAAIQGFATEFDEFTSLCSSFEKVNSSTFTWFWFLHSHQDALGESCLKRKSALVVFLRPSGMLLCANVESINLRYHIVYTHV